ncbi:two-component response regulator-like APRR1 [Lactuca sativa]|uniref:two-component response regulator-like APRR1 n=1 Tax=Lactuca sativa TaxID=4236 RepID=UPI000CD98BB2|nr:two-component response regulator-like APRR1 [Lactuca sativa]
MWEMEPKGISLGRGGVGGGNFGKTGDGFIDRSKVTILLCDNDSMGSGEVFTLLRKCSYQVISVKSPRQVIDALNAEGPNIDLILSEVDLPMAKGLKMLKYIMSKELQRIPVIMMSALDEVTLVVKCLRLGAADYLVKPLRTNELLNLWTHMWRRRRMLGLSEKKLMNCEFDVVPSDHSDVNTNSTVFSDDTDEKPRKSANEINVILAPGHVDKQFVSLLNNQSILPETKGYQQGKLMCGPKKSELKTGQPSAFLTYVKSSIFTKTAPVVSRIEKVSSGEVDQNVRPCDGGNVSQIEDFHGSSSFPDFVSLDESSTPPLEYPKPQIEEGYNRHSGYPYYLHGANAMNQVMMPPSSSAEAAMYHHHHHHQMPGMTSYPYYPVNLCVQAAAPGQGQNEGKMDRREAALVKFRQKRKERFYDKKIRYVNRKKLAERRPRVRGQFVRKANGIDVDLNGHPTSTTHFHES